MIFRKLLCGGFGILMSKNEQAEEILAFQCCAKMVWWLHLRSAPHILTHQKTTLNVWRYTGVSIVSDAVGMSWGVWGRDLAYLGGILGCQSCFGGYLRVQSMLDWAMLKQTRHFGTTLKCKICSTWPFWDIKIPKPPHKCFLKIIGLGHFWYFLSSSERNYL